MADVYGNGNGAPPVANRAVVQGELRSALASRHPQPPWLSATAPRCGGVA